MLTMLLAAVLILWTTADPKWHPAFLAASIVAFCIFAVWMWRRKVREAAEERPHILPADLWRWPAGLDAEAYRRRCEIFLKSRSWHIVSASPLDAETLRIVTQKDRLRVALHFAKSHALPDAGTLSAVGAFRREAGASQAAFVGDAKYTRETRAASSEANVRLMRFADLDGMDTAFAVPP